MLELGVLRVHWHPQFLEDQLTLFQPERGGGGDYAHHLVPQNYFTFRHRCKIDYSTDYFPPQIKVEFFFHFNWKDNCSTVHTKIVYKVLVGQSVG